MGSGEPWKVQRGGWPCLLSTATMVSEVASIAWDVWRSPGQQRLAHAYKPCVSSSSARPWRAHEEGPEGRGGFRRDVTRLGVGLHEHE